jgi:hypothetical protein
MKMITMFGWVAAVRLEARAKRQERRRMKGERQPSREISRWSME